ncbi:NmrA family transcriptional regulator [Nocardia sp. NBC_01503]|nr:NmrA family transcriptional regulator [Nocardia sp. NBC_01503]WTL31168.1 NmrA family transcriptional regulator [Nocardia sp. NBC_01503]
MYDKSTVLVLGGNGKTGRRVADRLRALGVPVRIGSRTATPPFDWENPASWAPALLDVRAAYVSFQPDLAVPGAPQAVRAFGEMAAAAGVRRLVLLSGRGADEAQSAEKLLAEAGPELTVVRASFFAQNFTEGQFAQPIREGRLVLPVGAVPEPFIDIDDIADAAVAALTEDGHAGKIYEVTGPRLLTFAEAVAEIAEATGRFIEYVEVSPEDYAAALRADGAPDALVDLLIYLFTTVLDGRNAQPADGVRQATGSAPRDFGDFARAAAATGVWRPDTV